MKKVYLSTLCLLLTVAAIAQSNYEPCGFSYILDHYRKVDPTFQERLEASYQESQRSSSKTTAGVYRIPVVFHIVYNLSTQNIHDSVVLNQLQIMNEAFRHTHSDTGNIRAMFKPLAGDAEIEFYMATKDPQGNSTNGITRTQTSTQYFMDIQSGNLFNLLEDIKKTNKGGKDPWPTDRYLNIWIADLTDKTLQQPVLAGYAPPPTNPLPHNWQGYPLPALIDGVVLHYQVVGNNNPDAIANYGAEGRNAVHEVGHFLGLRHIWGDVQNTADTCGPNGDDGIGDTPQQAEPSDITATNCSAYANQNTCGAGTSGDMLDLWENYMDYSNDKCQGMFTIGQINHMRTVLENQRVILKSPASVANYPVAETSFSMYPIPASNLLKINFDGIINTFTITDMFGKTVYRSGGEHANTKQHDISHLPSGNYFVTLQTETNILTKKLVIQN